MSPTIPAPFVSSVMKVEPQWIDYNGHLNMAYYNVLFDRGVDEAWEFIGMGPNYIAARNLSTMTAEVHVRYLREIHEGTPVVVHNYFLEADEKRIHSFQELRHADEDWVSATSETMTLHLDMAAKKVSPFPPDIAAKVQAIVAAHTTLPRPEGLGRAIGMKKR